MFLAAGLAPLCKPMPARTSGGGESVLAVLAAIKASHPTLWMTLEMNPKKVEQKVDRLLKIESSQNGFLIGSTRL
jgi:hypothetical protein